MRFGVFSRVVGARNPNILDSINLVFVCIFRHKVSLVIIFCHLNFIRLPKSIFSGFWYPYPPCASTSGCPRGLRCHPLKTLAKLRKLSKIHKDSANTASSSSFLFTVLCLHCGTNTFDPPKHWIELVEKLDVRRRKDTAMKCFLKGTKSFSDEKI